LFQVLEQAGSLFYMIDPLENTIISLPAIEGGQSREIKKQKLSRERTDYSTSRNWIRSMCARRRCAIQ